MDMMSQALTLAKKPHILIATPGRLVDHLENTKGFNLRALKFLVSFMFISKVSTHCFRPRSHYYILVVTGFVHQLDFHKFYYISLPSAWETYKAVAHMERY